MGAVREGEARPKWGKAKRSVGMPTREAFWRMEGTEANRSVRFCSLAEGSRNDWNEEAKPQGERSQRRQPNEARSADMLSV